MAGNRRYKVGTNPLYDSTFDRLTMESLILNPSGKTASAIQNFGTVSMLNSKAGLIRLLDEWRGAAGNSTKAFMLKRREVPSKLKEAESAIEKINERFEKLKQQAVNSGHYPPKEMPSELREELLRAEAMEDITKVEIKRLETALKKFPASGMETHSMPCLKHGAIGSSSKRGGILRFLDGQDVFPDPEGVLRIKDDRSPYNGMLTAEYYAKIVKTYKQSQAKLMEEYRAEARTAREQGKDPAAVVQKRPALPKWPEGVEHYKWKN